MKPLTHPPARRLANVCLAITISLAACVYTPPPSPPEVVTLDYGNAHLDLPSGSEIDKSRDYYLYAGAPVTSFIINLQFSDLPYNAILSIRAGGGTLIETIQQLGGNLVAKDGAGNTTGTYDRNIALASLPVPGNVGKLTVEMTDIGEQHPQITLQSLQATQPSASPVLPAITTALADSVPAFPLTLGQPVDLGFPTRATTYFLSLSGISVPTVDIILIGTGRFRVNSAGPVAFPFTDGSASQVRPDASLTGGDRLIGFLRLQVAATPTLTFAVTNEDPTPATGHARFVVLPVTGSRQPLSYPSSHPGAFLPGFIGVDHEKDPGIRKLLGLGTVLDCVNWEGKRGVFALGGIGDFVVWAPTLENGVPLCYDGHPGVDFLLTLGFVEQGLNIPVNASAAGIVTEIAEGHADTCFADPRNGFAITCPDAPNPGNYVAVRQADGLFAYYYHVRQGLVTVEPGWRVVCGEPMAAVGSAGESATSHIHLELRDLDNSLFPLNGLTSYDNARFHSEVVDPFQAGLWKKVNFGIPEFNCSP